MAKVRWASSSFKGEGSSKKCTATARNRAGRERPAEKWQGASGGGILQNGLGRFATLSTHLMGKSLSVAYRVTMELMQRCPSLLGSLNPVWLSPILPTQFFSV